MIQMREAEAQSAPRRASEWILLLVLLGGALAVIYSLGDHQLYGRSDSRYAEVSREMSVSHNWLIPLKRGEAHLTKPPLVYWAEAFFMRTIGATELAARLPAALAGVGTLVLLAWFTRRLYGTRTAIFAAAVMGVMPLHVVVSRLPLTDAPLALFWFAALAGGVLAVREPEKAGWPVLLWGATSLALLTKGPQALIPVGVLITWLLLANRRGELRSLRLAAGLPLSLAPLLIWMGLVLYWYPATGHLWVAQITGRSTEHYGTHPEPFWYYLPIFLAGLFPATLALRWPGLHYGWREGWQALRRADNELSVWVLAMAGPLLIFSVRSGKLATYLLPLCPVAAIVAAVCLERRLAGAYAGRERKWLLTPALGYLLVATVLLLLALAGVAVFCARPRWLPWSGSVDKRLLMVPIAAAAMFAAALWCWLEGRRAAGRMGPALLAVWGSLVLVAVSADIAENRMLEQTGIRQISRRAAELAQEENAKVLVLGSDNLSFSFYLGKPLDESRAEEVRKAASQQRLCVIARTDVLAAARRDDPAFLAGYRQTAVLNEVPRDKRFCILW